MSSQDIDFKSLDLIKVEQLIADLMDFHERTKGDESAFYCLQPLVVQEITVDGEEYLEVVDGQQRLTTILIILQALHQIDYDRFRGNKELPLEAGSFPDKAFSIKYETRVDSRKWLLELGKTFFDRAEYEKFKDKNCDYSHFAEVFETAYGTLKSIAPKFRDINRIIIM